MKRSPMPPRRTPLTRTAPPTRSTPLSAQSARRRTASAQHRDITDAVMLRDRGCVARVVPCGQRLDPHHVWRQSQGGPWTDWNLIVLCEACHRWVHEHPLLAWSHGWLVPAWTGEDGCHAAAALRSTPTTRLAPWLSDAEICETIRQDRRFAGSPRLRWPSLWP